MLVVHHMGLSQSERIVWLCEELQLDYTLVKHTRDPITSPASLTKVPGNATGKSPFVEDTDTNTTLSESTAICEYIINKYGNGKLSLQPDNPRYADYLQWFHFSNATLQAIVMCAMFIDMTGIPSTEMAKQFSDKRLYDTLQVLDDRLSANKWLAGDGDENFTAADIMTVFSLTTQRYFGPLYSLAAYPNILRYLQDCAARPAYQKAMEKGDPEMKLLLGADPPEQSIISAGGSKSDIWKKEKGNSNL